MPPIVDIHTHFYPPSYISLLSSRTTTPYIHHPPSSSSTPSPRLIILPSDDTPTLAPSLRGRPLSPTYSSLLSKLSFMTTHHISTSVLSLANPWLDFLPTDTAAATTAAINNDFEALCAGAEKGKLYFFGTLPLSASVGEIVVEMERLGSGEMRHARGVILGTSGLGSGLDDPALDALWAAAERLSMLLFIHPHYGLPSEAFGPRAEVSGHILPLSLGFPLETTIAFTRMYLTGVFDRFLGLKVLLAHAGGAIPFLAGRIESCVLHERVLRDEEGKMRKGRGVWEVLRENVWVDGVVYSKVGVKAAVEVVGRERVLFGTDHPFFPPLGEGGEEGVWKSVGMNVEAVRGAFLRDEEGAESVLGENAMRLLGLDD